MKIFLSHKYGIAVITAMALLAACASSPSTIYKWEGYQDQIYAQLNGESPQAQIDALEKGLDTIQADGKRVPPGYHAQLGMLYAGIGNDAKAIMHLTTEKTLFPESGKYMDLLLQKYKKKG